MADRVCDIIIPVWNQIECTKACIEGIRDHTRYPYRIIIIDNGSADETREYLANLAGSSADVTLIRNSENFGFIKATNQGLRISDGSYVCLMNNDAEAQEGWLTEMVSVAESDPGIGLVNPKSKKSSTAESKGRYIETNQCMGYCMLIKREVLTKIGYLDEVYGIGGFDDTDLSRRAYQVGYKCVCAKEAFVFHSWHTSFTAAGNRESIVKKNEDIFFKKWGRYLRIGYPIASGDRMGLKSDLKTSLSLAREWNWVHAWVNLDRKTKKAARLLNLPEHQSLRIFRMSAFKPVFYFEVLFRLIERRIKGRKLFDAVIVSDRGLYKFLLALKGSFSVPLYFIKTDPFSSDDSEERWRRRAADIVDMIKKDKEGSKWGKGA